MLLNALQSRKLLSHALEHRYAILAVNVDSPASITDCLEAALEANAPIILETSLWQLKGRSFGNGDAHLGMARYILQIAALANSKRYAQIPVVYHTDHIKGAGALELLQDAIRGLEVNILDASVRLRPSTLSLDSSELSEQENIQSILTLCQTARETGVDITLEMEAGVDDGLTPLDVAERLLGGVESQSPGSIYLWAPGVGTKHGLGNQDAFSADTVAQHQQFASKLLGRNVGIALHGSSGLPEQSLKDAVQAGVVKVNWSSESLLVRSKAALEFFVQSKQQLEKTHPQWKNTAMDNGVQMYIANQYQPIVEERMQVLGGAGQAQPAMQSIL